MIGDGNRWLPLAMSAGLAVQYGRLESFHPWLQVWPLSVVTAEKHGLPCPGSVYLRQRLGHSLAMPFPLNHARVCPDLKSRSRS